MVNLFIVVDSDKEWTKITISYPAFLTVLPLKDDENPQYCIMTNEGCDIQFPKEDEFGPNILPECVHPEHVARLRNSKTMDVTM